MKKREASLLPFSTKASETVTLLPYFRPRGPLTWLDPGAFGTLGVGGGFALGAKLCRPDSEVWIIYGDGSLGYSVAEFDTFTRHKVCLFCFVLFIFSHRIYQQCADLNLVKHGKDRSNKLELLYGIMSLRSACCFFDLSR